MVNQYLTIAATNSSGTQVGIVSSTLISANQNRVTLKVSNLGSGTVFLALGSTATVNQGIVLYPNTGTYEINGQNLYCGTISAITASGTTSCAYTEGTSQ